MEFICGDKIINFSNPGVVSKQLLNPENSKSKSVTVTEVHLDSGSVQPRHSHKTSEQIWYCLNGSGKLLLADNKEKVFSKGDVVRFENGEIHGLKNDTEFELIYISVTSPPLNFSYAYDN